MNKLENNESESLMLVINKSSNKRFVLNKIKIVFSFVIFVLVISISNISNIQENEFINKFDENENSYWKIIQYGNKDDNKQSMGYSIEGNKYGLVFIDGGWITDVEKVEDYIELIKQHDNTVDAWILTHFDTDHAGALLKLKEMMPNVKINKLYVQGFPGLELIREKAYTPDDWSIYEQYEKMPENERTIVNEGFEDNDIIGLKFKVFSVYDTWMDESLRSLLNNGSMMCKLSGNKESILFCGDITSQVIERNVLKKYIKELNSTIIQMAHHGNSVFTRKFYEIVNPKVAMFDAPDWLYNNVGNTSWFTVEENKELMEKMNVKIYKFEEGKNELYIQ